MQRILSVLGQAFRNCILILGLMSLISLSGLLMPVAQPSYAAVASDQSQAPKETIDVMNRGESAKSREEVYEEAAEAAESPEKVVKAEQAEIKEFKSRSGKGLVEGAQDLLNKVTGNE